METLSINTCRLHGSPKSSATVSPLHRVQNLDLMDDIPLPFPKDNHTNSPVSITPVLDFQSMTPSRRQHHHQINSELASSNKIKSGTSKQQNQQQQQQSQQQQTSKPPETQLRHRWHDCPELHKAMDGVTYIADHTKKEEESTKVHLLLLYQSFSTYKTDIIFAIKFLFCLGERRLEICSNGIRSTILMDIYNSRCCWYSRYNITSAHTLRY